MLYLDQTLTSAAKRGLGYSKLQPQVGNCEEGNLATEVFDALFGSQWASDQNMKFWAEQQPWPLGP